MLHVFTEYFSQPCLACNFCIGQDSAELIRAAARLPDAFQVLSYIVDKASQSLLPSS